MVPASVPRLKFLRKKAWAMRVQRLNNMFIYFRLIPSSVSMNKCLIKRVYLHKFAKTFLNVYRRLWFVWVTSCFNSGKNQWSPLKNLRVGKSLLNGQEACDVPDFSGILLFGNFLKGPIQYSLVQSQQWKHQNNVPNMFRINIKETRMTVLTLFCRLYCC